MGFGYLFIGYFFLLNLTWTAYTDALAGILMAVGFWKLAAYNKPFRRVRIPTSLLIAVGLFELVLLLLYAFGVTLLGENATRILSVVRFAVLIWLNVDALLGIRALAKEVNLPKLVTRVEASIASPVVVLLFQIVLEIPGLFKSTDSTLTGTVALICLLLSYFVIGFNLVTIYKAMSKIVIPEETSLPPLNMKKG